MSDDFSDRRGILAERIAGIALAEGLSALALRGLAAQLGTSGRMLLYYFGSKDLLVRCVLERVSAQMGLLLAAFASEPPTTPGALLAGVLKRAQQPDVAPFLRVWTEVVARGARGETPYDEVAAETVGGWVAWNESRLLPRYRGRGMGALILAFMDGVTLLELARPGITAEARLLLPGLLDAGDGDGQAPVSDRMPKDPR